MDQELSYDWDPEIGISIPEPQKPSDLVVLTNFVTVNSPNVESWSLAEDFVHITYNTKTH